MGSVPDESVGEKVASPIISSFRGSQRGWLDEPVLNEWKCNPSKIRVLEDVEDLHRQWSQSRCGPFSSHTDALWLETGKILRDAGLPWATNNVNMPEEIDRSWPLHFKTFERQAILAKGARVGCPDVTGYVTNWLEANLYGIRALQHELRLRTKYRPLLAGCCIEADVLEHAAQLLGLETVRVSADEARARTQLSRLSSAGHRPIIFAATLGSAAGKADDFGMLRSLQKDLPISLHLDASRTFDHVTTASPHDRDHFGIPRLLLRHPFEEGHLGEDEEEKKEGEEKEGEEKEEEEEEAADRAIVAATIVAGGANWVSPTYAAILKPPGLGISGEVKVEYVRGTDRTISGSRDSIGPLWVCLQELRFGPAGLQEVYHECVRKRQALCQTLTHHGVIVAAPPSTLDVLLRGTVIAQSTCQKWGIRRVSRGTYILTVQPSVSTLDLQGLARDLTAVDDIVLARFSAGKDGFARQDGTACRHLTRVAKMAVDHVRSVTAQSGGYPLNLALYSALGPVLGHFLPIDLPSDWIAGKSREMQDAYRQAYGLDEHDYASFPSCFTTGGTMGNMIALHTAASQFPEAHVYYSHATHYSIKKVVRDNDNFTHLWGRDKTRLRFVEVPSDSLGRIIPDELVSRALQDRDRCAANSQRHQVVLMCNLGSTFVGGRDDIVELRRRLALHGIAVAHTHVDGALELGFSPDVALGRPGTNARGGRPVVQGITVSHHKAMGLMVSGLVICHSLTGRLTPREKAIEPRAVFEAWLFQKMYSSKDLGRVRHYCLSNAERLRDGLARAGVPMRFNKAGLITVLERIPPWLIADFHLAPEGDWVHFITMPQITPSTVDAFVARIAEVDSHFDRMFDVLQGPLEAAVGQRVLFRRLRPRDDRLLGNIAAMTPPTDGPGGAEWLRRQHVQDAVSFAAVAPGDADRPLAVFLARATAERCLTPGPVLVATPARWDVGELEMLGLTGYRWLAQSMELSIVPSKAARVCRQSPSSEDALTLR